MTQDKREKLGVKTNYSSAKSKTCDQRAKKKRSATLLSLLNTEDDLSNIQWGSVPVDVQDWLTVTFARTKEAYSIKPEEQASIRTISYAVQADILVKRTFRTPTSPNGLAYPEEVVAAFKDIDKWDFNVFALDEACEGHSLKYLMCDLFSKYDLLSQFKIPITCLISFANALEVGYNKHQNPYHNVVHAADVTQTVHCIMLHTGMMHWFTDLEILAIIFSTSIHDYEHTGTTNHFHVRTRSETALLYNDKSVLENHHVSAAYQLMQNEEMNILANLTNEEWRELRRLVIEMVLATDMSHHFQQMKFVKHILKCVQHIKRLDKDKIMSMIVHAADISHPSKPWELHQHWAKALMEEFFKQGDKEAALGLPISSLCDRKTTNIAESQIGFIDVIVKPVFSLIIEAAEEIVAPLVQEAYESECSSSSGESGFFSSSGESRYGCSCESGTCTERNLLILLDIPSFGNHLTQNIEANRKKWKESQEPKSQKPNTKELLFNRQVITRLPQLLHSEISEQCDIYTHKNLESRGAQDGMDEKSFVLVLKVDTDFSVPLLTESEDDEILIGCRGFPLGSSGSGGCLTRLGNEDDNESPRTESNKAKDQANKGKKEGGKSQKTSKSKDYPSKSKKYCIAPRSTTTCDCQLCHSKAVEPMDVSFIVYNTGASELFQPHQDADTMDVTESYEELVDSQSSWRKAADQNTDSNIYEMRAMVPKTKPLSPNESDDVIIEEFIPEDPEPQITSKHPAITDQDFVLQPPNVGYIMTDLTQSDMEIFSLWNEEIMRRASEQQQRDHSRVSADTALQVAIPVKQNEGCQTNSTDRNFVLQVISFDTPSLTYAAESGPNCDPSQNEVASIPVPKNDTTPTNVCQQNETIPCAAAAVSVTSLSYGVFKISQ
ncbi:dual specificity calcium/calmodulin-dependent 3',5'-cyclic nucleotide phosphodiesterase 1A-like [Rhineura floridana]|uniref:dual specificity calcium/calmodulin-dependent 3',5'-cyclic nucleotide phosphodiesterase 1A-like n=1 Tax=Rhineura floridana TaxID=261503 RepID=UPI002AC85716|nr:dual specificity calcium/calmodulin-dependent 3',5'-cyclic nucleotide phosphodiesterase 1A-like [Rhineura floridana]